MKKSVKWILIISAVILIIAMGFGLMYTIPLLSMNPTKTGPIPGTNILAVMNQMGTVYFIKTNNGYIMIDAGSKVKKFDSSLKKAGIDANDVKWIFLTHTDYDHVAGLTMFPNTEIHMNEDELPLINGTAKRSPSGGNKMPAGFDINGITLLPDGRTLACNGTNVKCIKAPGHTIGSMVYLIDGRYLFTGDAFKIEKGKMEIHPFTMDEELAEKTIGHIKGIIDSNTIVFTSHYGNYKDQI